MKRSLSLSTSGICAAALGCLVSMEGVTFAQTAPPASPASRAAGTSPTPPESAAPAPGIQAQPSTPP